MASSQYLDSLLFHGWDEQAAWKPSRFEHSNSVSEAEVLGPVGRTMVHEKGTRCRGRWAWRKSRTWIFFLGGSEDDVEVTTTTTTTKTAMTT
jgi:hypothetical protein